MTRWEKYSFTALTALVAATGGAYFWMKYMMATDDPFAVTNHPLQGLMLQLHVLAAPAFLVVFGIILNSHVSQKIGKPIPNRRSGLLSLVATIVMVASGYLLQVLTGERAWQAAFVAHIGSSVVFTAAYVTHLAISAWMWARERRAAGDAAAA